MKTHEWKQVQTMNAILRFIFVYLGTILIKLFGMESYLIEDKLISIKSNDMSAINID